MYTKKYCTPLKLLDLFSLEIPQAWHRLEEAHNENVKNGYSKWPPEYYVASDQAAPVIREKYFEVVANHQKTKLNFSE